MEKLIYGMASKYDDVICDAVGMSREALLAVAKEKLSASVYPDGVEVINFMGKPIVTFMPITTHTESDGLTHRIVSTRKYQVHEKHNHSKEK
ncbi:hypothetical protein [Halocynthiibacter sp.]|uniref:hypothetical protein n=1 Tax=Halocynthiibacter sp. TaxID=1979210 RepID=UPI003C387E93